MRAKRVTVLSDKNENRDVDGEKRDRSGGRGGGGGGGRRKEEEEEDEQEEEVVLHMQVVGQEVIRILDLPDTYLRRDHKQQGVEMRASSARMCTRGPPTPLVQKTQTLHPQRL